MPKIEESPLKRWREEVGLTQGEMATYLGLDVPDVSRMERGHKNLTAKAIEALRFLLSEHEADQMDREQKEFRVQLRARLQTKVQARRAA